MKKLSLKITATVLSVLLLAGASGAVYALTAGKKSDGEKVSDDVRNVVFEDTEKNDISADASKDETVYVIAGADGTVQKIIVSDWIKNTLSKGTVTDKTELTDIENVKGDEKYTANGNNMTVWDAEGNDIYYQGNIEKELPVGFYVSYKLDGKTVSAEDIAGKSGKVTIRFDYENRQYETVSIDGKDEKIFVPFAMLTGMLLDSDTYRNIEVSNGKLINDGDRTAVIGFALPGLQENLGIEKEKVEIPDYVEITADVTDFRLGMTVTVATNELFNGFDTSKLDKIDEITGSADELTDAVNQLIDGSSALYGGLSTLLDKSTELVNGIDKMASGVKDLKDASAKLDDGVGELSGYISDLSDGLNELEGHNEELNGGAKQVFETLLSTATTQLNGGGLSVPALTIDNYAEVLNGVISSLDETAVYNSALSQVTAAVESNRTLIEQKVTAAVREQVAAQIIPVATGGQMTKESYDAAVSAGIIPDATKAQIEGAIDMKMRSDAVKATVSSQVDMQIKKAISDNMASEEVQSKFTAASEGAKTVISLKASLDSYNTFYLGLLSYTDGVATAAEGAEGISGGAAELKNGTSALKDGVAELYNGILELKNGLPALTEGVSGLKDGSMQLSDGLVKLNGEGISKIAELVNGDIKGLVTRFRATVDVSKNYRNFSGISDGTDGQVRFIYRTEEIEAAE